MPGDKPHDRGWLNLGAAILILKAFFGNRQATVLFVPCWGITVAEKRLEQSMAWRRISLAKDMSFSCRIAAGKGSRPAFTLKTRRTALDRKRDAASFWLIPTRPSSTINWLDWNT